MKKILISCFLTLSFLSNSFAQATNQGSNPASISVDAPPVSVGGTGILTVIVGNTGYDPMVPGTYRVAINIPSEQFSFIDPAAYITQNYPDWRVVSVNQSQLVLENTYGEISPSEAVAFDIQLLGSSTASPSVGPITARSYVAPGKSSQAGNTDPQPADDIASSVIVLPVTLTSFSAVKEGTIAQLKWATTQETNSDRFEVEHSLTGKAWTKIGTVASNGESTTLKNYTFSHRDPVNGENMYRLKMIDRDETFAYSRIQSVKFAGLGDSDLSVYPNPTVDVLKIRDYSNVTKVSIHDMNGRTVLESGVSTTGEINVRNLTSGIYLVRVSRANGLTSSQKIVVGK